MGQLVSLIDQEDMSNVLKLEFRQLLSKVAIIMVPQFNRLEHQPVTLEVASSSLVGAATALSAESFKEVTLRGQPYMDLESKLLPANRIWPKHYGTLET